MEKKRLAQQNKKVEVEDIEDIDDSHHRHPRIEPVVGQLTSVAGQQERVPTFLANPQPNFVDVDGREPHLHLLELCLSARIRWPMSYINGNLRVAGIGRRLA